MNSGNAHHTRRPDDCDAGGGGGGRDTLEVAVMPSLLVVASMSVTEVTTRTVLVVVLSLVGLILIQRSSLRSTRRHEFRNFETRQDAIVTSNLEVRASWLTQRLRNVSWLASRPNTVLTRGASLIVVGVLGGLALGIGLSLALVVLLNGMNSGLN